MMYKLNPKKLLFFCGLFVIFSYLIASNDVYTTYAVAKDQDHKGGDYVLWRSGIFILDLVLVNYIYQILLLGAVSNNQYLDKNLAVTLLLLSLIVVLGLFIQSINGYDLTYYDGLAYSVRTTLIILVCYECLKFDFIKTIKFVSWVMIIVAISSLLYIYMTGYEGVLGGRMNLIGMGPNVSADSLLLLFALNVYLHQKKLAPSGVLPLLALLCLVFIPLSGSRRAMLLLILALLYLSKKTFFVILCILGLILFYFIYFKNDFGIDIVGIQRTLETLEQISSGDIEDGRSQMYSTALDVLKMHPYGIGVSNWSLQEAMARVGVGSHTHNLFLQLYFKYGLAVIPLLLSYVICVVILIKKGLWWFAFYAIVNLNTGYGFWNDKYLIIFAITYIVIILFSDRYRKFA